MSDSVNIVELGPRDGLQNEKKQLPVDTKIALIEQLVACGLKTVEAGAFVSPAWVPQMAGSNEVLNRISRAPGVSYPVLVPNLKGYQAAQLCKPDSIAIFASASDAFSQKNINCSIDESLETYSHIVKMALQDGVQIRGYLSNILGCPYQGKVAVTSVIEISNRLLEMGCYEVSLCDTTGVGTPRQAQQLIQQIKQEVPVGLIAGHFHDTYGQALANTFSWLDEGVRTFDSSVSGLGGCPFAQGASGNLATEDLIYALDGADITTHVDLDKLIKTSLWISEILQRRPGSKVTAALSRNTANAA